MGNVTVLLNTGDNSQHDPVFTTANYSEGPYPQSVSAADVNDDGKGDLEVTDAVGNQAQVLLNNGSGVFGAAQGYSVGHTTTENCNNSI